MQEDTSQRVCCIARGWVDVWGVRCYLDGVMFEPYSKYLSFNTRVTSNTRQFVFLRLRHVGALQQISLVQASENIDSRGVRFFVRRTHVQVVWQTVSYSRRRQHRKQGSSILCCRRGYVRAPYMANVSFLMTVATLETSAGITREEVFVNSYVTSRT